MQRKIFLQFIWVIFVTVTAFAQSPPVDWQPGKFDKRTGEWLGGLSDSGAKRIQWAMPLGSVSYGTPVVADGKVFIATNNGHGYLEKHPKNVDLGVLLAFDAESGKFLWQYSSPKLEDDKLDWPEQGICSNPAVDEKAKRLYIVTNRCEVVCLQTESETDEAVVVWRFDMMQELGVVPHNMTSCSPIIDDQYVWTGTSNGVAANDRDVPNPNAPDFIVLDKATGKLAMRFDLTRGNILDGQWGSPAFYHDKYVLFPAGNGWLYGITPSQKKVVIRFDCNPKETVWKGHGAGDRNTLLATPTVSDEMIYIATGQDPESGDGPAVLWCLSTQKNDIFPLILECLATDTAEFGVEISGAFFTKDIENSAFFTKDTDKYEGYDFSGMHIIMKEDSMIKDLDAPKRRYSAIDKSAGETTTPNRLSMAVWSYHGRDPKSDEFEDRFHRTIGSVAVENGVVLIGDTPGVVHCLDAKTGKLHWTHDVMGAIWGTPLGIDGKFYLGTVEGDMVIFKAAPEKELLGTINMGAPIYGKPVFNAQTKTLYIATSRYLFAVR